MVIGNNKNSTDSIVLYSQKKFGVKATKLGCFLGMEIEKLGTAVATSVDPNVEQI